MAHFCYHRDRADSLGLRNQLRDAHWSYMDRYGAEMIARGPTLADDGRTPTGSVHIVDLPDPAAARAFALDEPNYQAGVYRDVMLRRWQNTLGRTMWDVASSGTVRNRYLVIGLGAGAAADPDPPGRRGDLLAYGPLLSDHGSTWLGTALLAESTDEVAARDLLTADRYVEIEVHRWRPGGRP
jgi:uncharacterized protein